MTDNNQHLVQPGTKETLLRDPPAEGSLRLEPGKPCPRCGKGIIEYDGWLNLVCPACKLTQGGAFT